MSNIETVIEGIEQFREDFIHYCGNSADWGRFDAGLAMLKEQKARVLNWDEIKNYSVVWGEFKGHKDIYPLIITLDTEGRVLSWNPGIGVSGEFLLLVSDEEDRKNTRCWNREPTEEQRRAVKWE